MRGQNHHYLKRFDFELDRKIKLVVVMMAVNWWKSARRRGLDVLRKM
jgi:hypothetical protein